MSWDGGLLVEYEKGRAELKERYNTLDTDDIERSVERKIIGSMINDMSYVIDWLKYGFEPGEYKGIHKRKVEQVIKKPIQYGVTGYWDESINAFIPKQMYKNPFLEADKRIDKELEKKANGF